MTKAAVSEHSFLDQLRLSRLLNETQLTEVERRCASGTTEHELPAALVREGWLTPFQVGRLVAGNGRGLVLGQYRLLGQIGRGGFGCVYKAMHGIMNRVVALKVISPELVEDSRARTWFLREVLATTQLHHPNIVLAYDADEIDGSLFLVMEHVEGLNLDQLVRSQGPLPIGLAFAMLHQAGCALQYAHEKGMVHRDIKPANLLVPNYPTPAPGAEAGSLLAPPGAAPRPLVKLVDFGLARLHGANSPHTLQLRSDHAFVGTPAYISPEQARSLHSVDIRSDLYSLGCTFYFALSGVAPFRGQSPMEIVIQHLEQEAPPLTVVRPETPPALVSIVRRLMAKTPEQRFQTPADLVAELSFLTGSWQAPVPAAQSPPAASSLPPYKPAAEDAVTQHVPAAPVPTSQPRAVPTGHARPSRVLHSPSVTSNSSSTAGPTAEPEPALAGKVGVEPAPSAPPAPAPVDAALRLSWAQWLAVIQTAAEGRKPHLSPAAYRQLHALLTEAIRGRASHLVGQDKAAWQRLEALVTPWLTLETLNATDLATLRNLCQKCQQVAGQLSLGRGSGAVWGWKALIAALLLMVCLGILTAVLAGAPVAVTWPSLAPAWRFLQTTPLVVLVPPLVLGVFLLLPRLLHR